MRGLVGVVVLNALAGCSLLLSSPDDALTDAGTADATAFPDAPAGAWAPWISYLTQPTNADVELLDCVVETTGGLGTTCGDITVMVENGTAVIAGGTILLSGLTVRGEAPLAFVGKTISVMGSITLEGANVSPGHCSFEDNPAAKTGGGGGGGQTKGGSGGAATNSDPSHAGGDAWVPHRELLQGCPGQASQTAVGGRGGNALHLQAVGAIDVSGGILAGGQGGIGGAGGAEAGGGGGGGSGGMIVLDAPRVTVLSIQAVIVAATGGGGAGGAVGQSPGAPGAGGGFELIGGTGGAAGTADGGGGGNGLGIGGPDDAAGAPPGTLEGAGGGGGGAAGHIIINSSNATFDAAAFSPSPSGI